MSYHEDDILFEQGSYWVLKVKGGVEVYKIGITHSTRVAGIYLNQSPCELLARAKESIERRIAADKTKENAPCPF